MKKLILTLLVIAAAGAALLYRPSLDLEKLKSKYTDENSAFVQIDEMNAHYRKSGSGPVVLLIHGTADDNVGSFVVVQHDAQPRGLVGLPVTGFSAYEFENDFAEGGDVKAYYGGLFGHKASVRATTPAEWPQD